jgi:hypothetical protein
MGIAQVEKEVAWPGMFGLDVLHCCLCGRWETALPLYPSVRFIQSDIWQTLGKSPWPMWKKMKELRFCVAAFGAAAVF